MARHRTGAFNERLINVPRCRGDGRDLFSVLRSVNNTKLLGGGLTANKRGLFEVFFAKGLNVVCSSGVGGGSHVYSGLNVPPPDPNYWDGLGGSLSSQNMQSSYERVLAKLEFAPCYGR